MNDPDGQAAAFEAKLRDAVAACGVDVSSISLCYSNELQDYDLVINGGPLEAGCIASIEAAVDFSATLSFTDPSNAAALVSLQTHRARQLLREKAKTLVGLPKFDQETMTLAAFALELEAYCGLASGQGLKVLDERTLTFTTSSSLWRTPQGVQRLGRLMEATSAALVEHENIRVVIVGGT